MAEYADNDGDAGHTGANCVFVCQGRTCKKQGAIAVLAAFRQLELPGWNIYPLPCRGLCGNGPMVGVLPGNVWYWQVRIEEVPVIAEQHLLSGHPVQGMIYPLPHFEGKRGR